MGKAEYLAEGQEPSVRQNRDLDDLSAVLGQLELENNLEVNKVQSTATDTDSKATPATDTDSWATTAADSDTKATPAADSDSSVTPAADSDSGATPAADSDYKATPAADDGEESDEDNENVIIRESNDATSVHSEEDDEEVYQSRGPCKSTRSQFSSSRYNPMISSDWNDTSAPSYQPLTPPYQPLTPPYQSLTPAYQPLTPAYQPLTPTYQPLTPPYQPLTPPHCHSTNGLYDELLEPASLQFPVGDVQQPVDDLPPLYGTPVTTGGDYSPGYGGSPPTNAFQGDALDAVTQQMGNDLLSANYLDALEDAVDRTVIDSNMRFNNSNSVRLIMDSLRSIDPTELDYISPSSPGPAHYDLEEVLSLSTESWTERALSTSPSLSDSSPSLPSTPLSPYNDREDNGPFSLGQSLKSGASAAVAAFREMCDDKHLLGAAKRVACRSGEDLCRQDPDGDTCSMVVVCKPSNSPKFYENLFVLQQHMQKLRMCCSSVVDTAAAAGGDSCLQCGASQQLWHSPLTLTNNAGDTVLSCAVKMRHPEHVINYLCAGLVGCPQDLRREFEDSNRSFLSSSVHHYPVLNRFL